MAAKSTKPRIFVTQPIAESALQRLCAVADVEVSSDSSRVLPKEALIAAVERCDILLSLLHDTVDRDVLAANPKFEILATNSLGAGENTNSSIAISNGEIFIRTHKYLWCIAETK